MIVRELEWAASWTGVALPSSSHRLQRAWGTGRSPKAGACNGRQFEEVVQVRSLVVLGGSAASKTLDVGVAYGVVEYGVFEFGVVESSASFVRTPRWGLRSTLWWRWEELWRGDLCECA